MASTTGSNSTGRQSSSLKSEKPPPSSASTANGGLRSGNAAGIANGHGQGGSQQHSQSVRSSASRLPSSSSSATASSRRSVTPKSRNRSPSPSPSQDFRSNDPEHGRVRVAVRLRPRNAEDLSVADYPDCIEVQPELKKLKLIRNNWSTDSYRFDEIFADSASQKRIYEVVAKPVVESVLEGYNGTVMAYGQTGTGKTYTLGRLGKDDASERGIMARALEDILANTSPTFDSVEVSYLQLYLESIQDLLSPEKTSIPIAEDGRTGEVSVPGATVVKIKHLEHFIELLRIGEANRHAANTKLNTESSRSHAILMVNIRRSVQEPKENDISLNEHNGRSDRAFSQMPTILKSKLLIVDLAGSERLDKSGSEGHQVEEAKFINLSLTSLGKCINALAENSPHIPTRDSKLTRLLRDSFGGSARTSLIITIGPSSRYHAETSSTILFGQRAMKVVNTMKIKEEFDYESLCRMLEAEVDQLHAEVDKQKRWSQNFKLDMEKKLRESQISYAEKEKNLVSRSEHLEKENDRLVSEKNELLKELDSQKENNSLKETSIASLKMSLKNSEFVKEENVHLKQELNDVLKELNWQKNNNDSMRNEVALLEMSLGTKKQQQLETSAYQKLLADTTQMYEKKVADLVKQSEVDAERSQRAEEHLHLTKNEQNDLQNAFQQLQMENSRYKKILAETTQMYEGKIDGLTRQLGEEHSKFADAKEQLSLAKKQEQKDSKELGPRINDMHQMLEATVNKLEALKSEYKDLQIQKEALSNEVLSLRHELMLEENRRKAAASELADSKQVVPESEDGFEEKRPYTRKDLAHASSSLGQRNIIAKICEEVGLQKILSLLTSGDLDVQIHAVKVVANLAAEDGNQEKIVNEGGLGALLILLESSQNTTILRVASGAIANLAMNGTQLNQGLIVSKGGARLLASTAARTDDPQTLRMVAGAIANLCGNESLHIMLKEEGAIKALVGMTRSGNIDVIAQVARGMANFAKCESRGILQGNRVGRSPLIDDNALTWLITNSSIASSTARRHIELALCHLAQNENNAMDFVASGGLKELLRISAESSKEDIRNLAKKTVKVNPIFRAELIS